jgi:hypothetical protein
MFPVQELADHGEAGGMAHYQWLSVEAGSVHSDVKAHIAAPGEFLVDCVPQVRRWYEIRRFLSFAYAEGRVSCGNPF